MTSCNRRNRSSRSCASRSSCRFWKSPFVKRWSGARRGTAAIACCNSHDGVARPHETETGVARSPKWGLNQRNPARPSRSGQISPRFPPFASAKWRACRGVAARLTRSAKKSALARVTRSFAASDPRITGIIARCHRDATGPAHILCRCASTGSADRREQNDRYRSGWGAANTRHGGARISPKTRGRSQWRDARPLTIFAF